MCITLAVSTTGSSAGSCAPERASSSPLSVVRCPVKSLSTVDSRYTCCTKRLSYGGAVAGTWRARRVIKAAIWLTSRRCAGAPPPPLLLPTRSERLTDVRRTLISASATQPPLPWLQFAAQCA
jgi:hypothetical protein